MDTAKLRDALHEANQGLHETSTQFEALRLQKQHLEAVVASISALLGADERPSAISSLPPAVSLSEAYSSENQPKMEVLPQWAMARDLLLETGRPMTVPEMAQILASRGQVIHSDGLRVAMIRRTDLFIKPEYGKYGLKAWEAAYREKAEEEAFSYNRENPTEDARVI
jgi:hypothetical protein